jgi:hypothetical protein
MLHAALAMLVLVGALESVGLLTSRIELRMMPCQPELCLMIAIRRYAYTYTVIYVKEENRPRIRIRHYAIGTFGSCHCSPRVNDITVRDEGSKRKR